MQRPIFFNVFFFFKLILKNKKKKKINGKSYDEELFPVTKKLKMFLIKFFTFTLKK